MKTQNKKANRLLIIVGAVSAFVILLLVVFLVFGDVLIANIKLRELRDNIEGCDKIVVNDPLYEGDFSYGAEISISDTEAARLRDDISEVLEKASYSKRLKGDVGFWDIQMKFYTSDGVYALYLKEDSVYIVSRGGYLFDTEKCKQEYAEIYEYIEELIKSN